MVKDEVIDMEKVLQGMLDIDRYCVEEMHTTFYLFQTSPTKGVIEFTLEDIVTITRTLSVIQQAVQVPSLIPTGSSALNLHCPLYSRLPS